MLRLNQLAFRSLILAGCWFAVAGRADAALVIQVDYSGDSQYQAAFDSAAATWQSLLVGYQDGFVTNRSPGSSAGIGQTLTTVNIAASFQMIDGVGGILGQAGPTEVALDASGFLLATDGIMQFDSADFGGLASSNINSLILHEMAHVLGFGTLWAANGVYVDGSGEFTGANATAAWQNEFGQSGTPDVELLGGVGTADAHWNENSSGSGLTGITDSLGRDMRDELMTGWLNTNSFISDMTVASFRDIGFTTRAVAVPEPASVVVLSLVGVGWVMRRRGVVGCLGVAGCGQKNC